MTATGRRGIDVRTALLDATVAELADVGADRASMRSIARRVGISHQAVTHYFADRTALLTAVATQGWQQLHDAVASALAELRGTDPGDGVTTIGRTYVQFARTHRPRFQLMFTSSLLDADQVDLVEAKAAMWSLHLETVESDRRRGWGADVPAAELAVAAFSLAHGMASLEEHLPGLLPEPDVAGSVLGIVKNAVATARQDHAAAVLYVGDLARMRAFYQGCFAMTVVDSADDYCGLRTPAQVLTLVRSAEAMPAATPASRRTQTAFKLALTVDSIAAVRALATDLGGVVDPAGDEWAFRGAVHCDLVDPEGNVVQLIEAVGDRGR